MTFKKFEQMFMSRYPSGSVTMHGKFAGNERNKKVAVTFNESNKVYEYYGAYEDILCRVGIKCISKSRVEGLEKHLRRLESEHGKTMLFGSVIDNSAYIAQISAELEEIRSDYTIV